MKKLFFLFSLVVLLGVSANVMGQDTDTGATPYLGTTHTYSITPGSATNTVLWWITTGVDDEPAAGTYQGTVAGDFYVTSGGSTAGTPVTANAAGTTISIKWNNVGTYYIHVREFGSIQEGASASLTCTQEQVFEVKPQAVFDLAIVNVSRKTDKTTGEDDNDVCWDTDVPTVAGSGASITYDDGVGTATFRVDASGIVDGQDWEFTYDFSLTDATVTSVVITDKNGTPQPTGTGTTGSAGGTVVIDGATNASDNNYVLIVVTIDDADTSVSTATVGLNILTAKAHTGSSSTVTVETSTANNSANAQFIRPTTNSIIAAD